MTLSQTLRKNPLFANMSEKTIECLAANSHRKHCKKGEDLFAMGEPVRGFFYIESGWVKVYRVNRDGEESVINVFGPGETFAEAAAFGPMQRYPASAQAVEEAELLEIPRQIFVDKIRENSDLALSVLGTISTRQNHLIQQVEQLTAREAPQRLGFFFLRLCPPGQKTDITITLPYDKALVARCLNIQPETFSRAMKKLESCGVTAEGKTISIRDTGALARFCDTDERAGSR